MHLTMLIANLYPLPYFTISHFCMVFVKVGVDSPAYDSADGDKDQSSFFSVRRKLKPNKIKSDEIQ